MIMWGWVRPRTNAETILMLEALAIGLGGIAVGSMLVLWGVRNLRVVPPGASLGIYQRFRQTRAVIGPSVVGGSLVMIGIGIMWDQVKGPSGLAVPAGLVSALVVWLLIDRSYRQKARLYQSPTTGEAISEQAFWREFRDRVTFGGFMSGSILVLGDEEVLSLDEATPARVHEVQVLLAHRLADHWIVPSIADRLARMNPIDLFLLVHRVWQQGEEIFAMRGVRLSQRTYPASYPTLVPSTLEALLNQTPDSGEPPAKQHEARIALKRRVCSNQILLLHLASRPGATDIDWFGSVTETALALRRTLEHWHEERTAPFYEERIKQIETLADRGIEPLRGWVTRFIEEWKQVVNDSKCGSRTCPLCGDRAPSQ